MKCIKCGALLEDSFRFCDACGTRQKPTLKCSCGRILEDDFKFCPECGRAVTKVIGNEFLDSLLKGIGTNMFLDRGDYIELKKPVGNIRMIEKGCSNYMMDWNHAMEYAENLRKGGFTDWRVPTKEELEIIYKIKDACGIENVNAWWFWSSTNLECLSFFTGNWCHDDSSSAINTVRCVR